MIDIQIPGRGVYHLSHLVLDVNGTITLEGRLIDGVVERVQALRDVVEVHCLTANTRGQQDAIDASLGISAVRIRAGGEAAQKEAFVRELGGGVCAVGNGAIDAGMLRQAALGIAVVGEEGLATEALQAADLVVPHVNAALDLLLDPLRLVATLRR